MKHLTQKTVILLEKIYFNAYINCKRNMLTQ